MFDQDEIKDARMEEIHGEMMDLVSVVSRKELKRWFRNARRNGAKRLKEFTKGRMGYQGGIGGRLRNFIGAIQRAFGGLH